jgi:BirA family biotin operon repressor/biotin-[acetyl-CoA-carboxylase] ligase
MMKVYTDSPNFADLMLQGATWRSSDLADATLEIRHLAVAVFAERPVFEAEVQVGQRWQYLFVAESSSRSQYDLLIEQKRLGHSIPDGVLCLSGAGSGLHGLRQRPWAAEAGNIHLSVHLLPPATVTTSGIPFMVLAAVSVLDAIDSVQGLGETAGIKWVNDILLGDAKVAGVLAYTEGAGKAVDAAVLGIGLNVETTPTVEGTLFVPCVGSISDFSADCAACTQGNLFGELLTALDRNYQLLLDGCSGELLDRYRERSIVVGREVTVYVDDVKSPLQTIARGMVERVGDNLELFFAGCDAPVTRGRLVLESKT